MFGLGMGELLVILAVALLIFGPQRLPELASGLGKAIRQFRRATRDLQSQIEVDETVRRPIHELRAALRDEPPPIVPAAGTAPTSVTPSVAAVPHPAEGAPQASGLPSTPTPAEKTT